MEFIATGKFTNAETTRVCKFKYWNYSWNLSMDYSDPSEALPEGTYDLTFVVDNFQFHAPIVRVKHAIVGVSHLNVWMQLPDGWDVPFELKDLLKTEEIS